VIVGRIGGNSENPLPAEPFGLNPFYITPITRFLFIARDDSDVVLSWPLAGSNFVLQATASLPSPAWNPVVAEPKAVDQQWTVTVPLPTNQLYYRLERQ
jgi:hypothetical protein